MKKIVTLGYYCLLIIGVNINKAKAQNSEKKISDNREKVQKATGIHKSFKKQTKKGKHITNQGTTKKI